MNIANKVAFFNNTSSKCLTIHNYGIRTWDCNLVQKKVQYTEILMNQIKRVFTCCVIDSTDSFAYLGTKTGDIVEISLTNNLFKRIGPTKRLFSQGVNCINLLSNGDLTNFILDPSSLNLKKRVSINHPVLPSLFKLSRDFCYKIDSNRGKIIK